MKLLLFDIDGTLLLANGQGRTALEAATSAVCGRACSSEGVSFSGRTDPAIMRDILQTNGVPESEIDGLVPEVLARYADILAERLRPEDIRVLPGVAALLERLAAEAYLHLALLTGNLERTALLKVEYAGLAPYFGFGAYGSDHIDRAALPPLAVKRAHTHTGHRFEGKNIVIIGDTEHDIACGRGVGAFSVGVCTGRFSRADLEPHRPDLLLDDLSDADGFLRSVQA